MLRCTLRSVTPSLVDSTVHLMAISLVSFSVLSEGAGVVSSHTTEPGMRDSPFADELRASTSPRGSAGKLLSSSSLEAVDWGEMGVIQRAAFALRSRCWDGAVHATHADPSRSSSHSPPVEPCAIELPAGSLIRVISGSSSAASLAASAGTTCPREEYPRSAVARVLSQEASTVGAGASGSNNSYGQGGLTPRKWAAASRPTP